MTMEPAARWSQRPSAFRGTFHAKPAGHAHDPAAAVDPIDAPVIMSAPILIVIMGVRLGLETFSRVAELWFPGYILLSFVLILTLFPTIDLNKIQPIFDQGFKPILRGTVACIALPFMELQTKKAPPGERAPCSHIKPVLGIGITSAGSAVAAFQRMTCRSRSKPQSDFPSAPPEVAVQLHEAAEESSISFDLLLSVSIYYFSSSVISAFRLVIWSHVDPRGRTRPKTGPWSTWNPYC